MSRFQIEEIIGQDKHGVVFRAVDEDSGRIVALRRFLPFGHDGGGLTKEEALAFEIASKRLAELSHVALRSVIMGSVDPIDGIPYLVTEWVDGISLREALGKENLHPSLVIDVLRIALEVSIVLSHVLGEEAVWVETEVESIIVGARDSGRGFTFWISPFKWLGGEYESRRLSTITDLGEDLAGWKRKLVSDQAGNGLGGWMKWVKTNPDARLEEALEKLSEFTDNAPPPTEADLVERSINPAGLQIRQPSAKKPLIFAACAALVVLGAALFYLHKTSTPPRISDAHAEQKITQVIRDPEPVAKSTPEIKSKTPSAPSAAADASARAEELSRKAAEESSTAQAGLKAAEEAVAARGGYLTVTDKKLLMTMEEGAHVEIRGIPSAVRFSNGKGKKSLYLFFSDPLQENETAVVIHRDDFQGKYELDPYQQMIGKEVIIQGVKFKETLTGRILVKARSQDAIQLVK